MDKEIVKQWVDELCCIINKYSYEYYILDELSVFDVEYDRLMQELIVIEEEYLDFRMLDFFMQCVGGVVFEVFQKVIYGMLMFSLGNVFNDDDFCDFDCWVCQVVGDDVVYNVELKIDGFVVFFCYEDGYFVRGVIRGDGMMGEDIMENLKMICNILFKMKCDLLIEVCGEVYMLKCLFEMFNEEWIKNEEELFVNL